LVRGIAGVLFYGTAGGVAVMEQRISVITLGVKSLAEAKRFYVDGLGWKPGFENNEIIFFQAGGNDFRALSARRAGEGLSRGRAGVWASGDVAGLPAFARLRRASPA
jgi:catechol 2,3-dioxygenase-like lactoylglutathione lyase family enzyme